MNNIIFSIASALLLVSSQVGLASELISKSPEGAKVYFIEPVDGQTLSGEITVKFGLSGMGVAPAGIDIDNTGHHHLLIDLTDDQLPDMTQSLPSSDNVKHFGKGQTETTIQLEPGEHTLQLLLGNHLHIPHDPPVMSEKISVTVN